VCSTKNKGTMDETMSNVEEQKIALSRKSKLYEVAITDDFEEMKEDLKGIGTKTLLIGGAFLAGIFIAKKLFSGKKKPEKIEKTFYADPNAQMVIHQPKQESTIVRMIKEHIALFIIGIIKEKLAAYIREAELKYIAKANDMNK
jgi:hypothetical protein